MQKCPWCLHFCCWVRNNPQSCDTSKLLSAWELAGLVSPLPIYLPVKKELVMVLGDVQRQNLMLYFFFFFHTVTEHIGLQSKVLSFLLSFLSWESFISVQ